MRKVKPKSYEYIEGLSQPENNFMSKARVNSEKLHLDGISISKVEAHLISFYLEGSGARKVVEIGTLTGLSALYILESVGPGGFLWTFEKSQEHASLAEVVLREAYPANNFKVLVGDAKEKLSEIENEGPFDAIFIDGNKAAYLDYFNWAQTRVRSGGMIIVDNVFLSGAVWGGETTQKFNEKQILAVQTMNRQAFTTVGFKSAIIPTEEGLLVCKKL